MSLYDEVADIPPRDFRDGVTRDFLLRTIALISDGGGTVAISEGGTGGTTVAEAQANLGLQALASTDSPTFAGLTINGVATVTGLVNGRDLAADGAKLDGIEAGADVTDAVNVTAAGALMDSELADLVSVKAINQGLATTNSPTFAGLSVTGNITLTGTIDGRDPSVDGAKLDGIEAGADVTDATNVAAAGALMDSEVVSLPSVKAIDQGLSSTSSPTFNALTLTSLNFGGTSITAILDEDSMASDSAAAVPTQQSVKAYVDAAVAGALTFQGGYDAATNTPDLDTSPSGITQGDLYVVEVAGTFFSTSVVEGNQLIANQTNPTLESHWTIVATSTDAATIKSLYESNADTNAFTDALLTKLNGMEAGADVTDTANVTAAGALMDSELTNISAVKALNQSLVTTASPTFAALTINGAITVTGLVDGRDIAADGTKLDGIEALADVTDTANVTAAGALMDSELANIAAVKALNQSLVTTATPTFAGLTVNGNITLTGLVDGRDVATDGTKLDGIESGADVTDTTSVTAAGALMDSEVSSLSGIKTLTVPNNTTISTFGASLTDDANAATARTTLGLGTGATATVQTSDTDTTAGRLMPVGAFGLGADAPNVTDLTADLQTGFYRFTESTATGSPGSSAYQCSLAVIRTTNGTMFYAQRQTANSANIKVWHGSRNALTGAITWAEIAIEGQSPEFAGLTVSGNITVTGTVDGRDVAADGAKLDGIESGATADQTAAEILTAIKTVDGAASGLDADLLDGKQGATYLYQDGTDNGLVTITVDDDDFIVRDTTDAMTHYIWRNHAASVLYLGTPDAVPTLRATLDANDNPITGAGEIDFQGGLKSFASRAAFVTWIASNTPVHMAAYFDGTHWYIGQTSATAIPDMPGLIPAHPYHFDQWGITRETNTGQSTSAIDNATKIQACLDWIGDNGGGTVYTGGGVIAFDSTIYWGDRASPVVIQGNGRGVPSSGKASTRQTPGTRFLWGGTAGNRGLVITSDRTDTLATIDGARAGGSGILDCFIDGGEVGTAATAVGGPMLSLISANDPQIRVLIGYAPGGCFESTTLTNVDDPGVPGREFTGAGDTQRGFIDIETTDVNTSNEPYWHVLFTGKDANDENTSLVPSIRLKLSPESTAIAAHIEFMDGSRFEFLHASTRTAASGNGGKVIIHADDTLNTYHGGAYSNQGHARRLTFDYTQFTEGMIHHATIAGTSSAGPNIIKHYSRGNGAPAPTIEAGSSLQYWDENVGLYANYIVPGYTATEIADITHAVNTTYKQGGKIIQDTTNRRIMMARGSAAGGAWDVVDGSASVTPS